MKQFNNNRHRTSSPLLLSILILGGCATAKKDLVKEPAYEPPRASKAASFDVIHPRKIVVVSADTPRSLFKSPAHWHFEVPLVMMIEDLFTDALLSKGYTVASRSDIGPLLQEIGFQHSGLTEADAAKLGRMLNVSCVLTVHSINHNDEIPTSVAQKEECSVTLAARLISVETAEVIWVGSYTHRKFTTRPSYASAYRDLVQKLFVEAGRSLALTFPDFK